MKARFHKRDGTVIHAEGTAAEIAVLARLLQASRSEPARTEPDRSDAITERNMEAVPFVPCSCGTTNGCLRHPWMHRRVAPPAELRH
jgi:hypothetical protein